MPSTGDQKLWIPNHRGALCRAHDLVFNDAPWLEAQGLNLVHAKLSYDVRPRTHFTFLALEIVCPRFRLPDVALLEAGWCRPFCHSLLFCGSHSCDVSS